MPDDGCCHEVYFALSNQSIAPSLGRSLELLIVGTLVVSLAQSPVRRFAPSALVNPVIILGVTSCVHDSDLLYRRYDGNAQQQEDCKAFCWSQGVAQERIGFNYNDEYNVRSQIELIKKEIIRLKDHPSVILWGIGNEVDLEYHDHVNSSTSVQKWRFLTTQFEFTEESYIDWGVFQTL